MGRRPRVWSESGYYHVVTRGNDRKQIFHNEEDRLRYLGFLAVAFASWNINLHHYCLMPNHTHSLVSVDKPLSLSRAMHSLQRRYWFHMKRTYKRSGHLWQGRYHSFAIEADSYLMECGRYIERNPYQAKLVASVGDYRWSSYEYYAWGKEKEVTLTPSPAYQDFGNTIKGRQEAYQRYVETDRPYDSAMNRTVSESLVYV